MTEEEIKVFKEGIEEVKSKKYYTVYGDSKPVNEGIWFKDDKYSKYSDYIKRNF